MIKTAMAAAAGGDLTKSPIVGLERAQWLRELAVHPKGMGLIPSTHMATNNF